MPKKLSPETIKGITNQFLQYPAKSNKQIAKELKVSPTKVDEMRREYAEKYDVEFMKMTAGKFIQCFGVASAYWTEQIERLEADKKSLRALLGEKKIIFKMGEAGQKFPDEVDLDPRDKALIIEKIDNIEKQQSDLQSKILFQASQGEVRAVIKLMRSGELSAFIK